MRYACLLLIATVGCRGPVDPPTADITGIYALVRLRGQPLPVVDRDEPIGRSLTVSGAITLNADSTFADVWVQEFHATLPAQTGLVAVAATSSCIVVSMELLITRCTLTKFGTWRANSAGDVILTGEEFGATPYTQNATMSGPNLTKLFGTWEWRYEKR